MKFVYEYRTSDNVRHTGVVNAANREAAFALLKSQGIRPGSVTDAPGFFNKLLGRGKRWIVIGVLAVVSISAIVYANRMRTEANTAMRELDGMTRRQILGDAAVIEKGIRSGWANVFQGEGERFLASFAIPGVPAGQRNTSEREIEVALARQVEVCEDDSIEVRQIKAMVEGMKNELRQFIADGGTIVEYGHELVERQEKELRYRNLANAELESLAKSGADSGQLEEVWEKRNAELRRMGVKLVPMPGEK